VLVNLDSFNRALLDWARLSEVQNPEQYFLDPQSEQSQAALQNKQKQAQQQQRDKAMLMQLAFGLEQLRTAFEKYRTDAELQFKYFAELLNAEVKEAEIVGRAAADLVKQKAGANEQNRITQRSNGTDKEQTATTDSGAA
jgi:hypothetical protein